jgi:hypothetical protein
MAFDGEAFESHSFWTQLIEKIKLVLGPLTKAISLKLTPKFTEKLVLGPTTKTISMSLTKSTENNIKVTLQPIKSIEISLRMVE